MHAICYSKLGLRVVLLYLRFLFHFLADWRIDDGYLVVLGSAVVAWIVSRLVNTRWNYFVLVKRIVWCQTKPHRLSFQYSSQLTAGRNLKALLSRQSLFAQPNYEEGPCMLVFCGVRGTRDSGDSRWLGDITDIRRLFGAQGRGYHRYRQQDGWLGWHISIKVSINCRAASLRLKHVKKKNILEKRASKTSSSCIFKKFQRSCARSNCNAINQKLLSSWVKIQNLIKAWRENCNRSRCLIT